MLSLEGWALVMTANPALGSMKPDVEALLVNRTQGDEEYFIVPIDRCYALVGTIRRQWRGLSGGSEVWDAIGEFFARLRPETGGRRRDRSRFRRQVHASTEYHSAAPLLVCALCVTNKTPGIAVRNVMLRCQIRIEPTQRLYGDGEHERLIALFGLRERWGQTLHSFLWTHTDVLIPGFRRRLHDRYAGAVQL